MAESTLVGPDPVMTTFLDSRIYSPLMPGELRLLKLHHGNGRLRCSLLVTSHDPSPEHEALSYVWGSQADAKSIHLNKRPYFVARSLLQTLLKLRLRDEDRILWIDAVDTNQSDLAERATEVAKMSIIFARAAKTLVWLGQGSGRIEEDVDILANCNVGKANLTFGPGGTGLPTKFVFDRIFSVACWEEHGSFKSSCTQSLRPCVAAVWLIFGAIRSFH